jgi:hypothetical protein
MFAEIGAGMNIDVIFLIIYLLCLVLGLKYNSLSLKHLLFSTIAISFIYWICYFFNSSNDFPYPVILFYTSISCQAISLFLGASSVSNFLKGGGIKYVLPALISISPFIPILFAVLNI